MLGYYQDNDRVLAEALPHGIVILNQTNQLNWWNRVASRLLGLDAAHDKGKSIVSIIAEPLFLQLQQGLSTNSIKTTAPSQQDIWVSMRLQPYWGQQKLLFVQDITQAERLRLMRQNFIANASHELRTPLAVFRGYLELLQDHEHISRAQLKDIHQQMSQQSQRMERLVQELLLLSRLENDQPDREAHQNVPVASLLNMICEDAQSLSGAGQHQFYLEADETLELKGNAEELRSAFSNIIFNAVRYTPVQGKIKVFWYQDDKGKHLRIEDNGIGIPKESIPRVTERFYRVDKARAYQDQGGTGLGLAIVKHVLLRHEGRLTIESDVGKGSIFCCSFP